MNKYEELINLLNPKNYEDDYESLQENLKKLSCVNNYHSVDKNEIRAKIQKDFDERYNKQFDKIVKLLKGDK